MTEKYFAATPFTCHNQFLKSIKNAEDNRKLHYGIWLNPVEIKWIASDVQRANIMKKFLALRPTTVLPEGVFKDFEGMHAPAHQK